MNDALRILETVLRNNSLHVTTARRRVFVALYGKEPQSMNELHKATRHDINRTSVYRVIELFEALGVVHRIQIGWKYKVELSDLFVEHHHHASCVQCGRIFAIKEDVRIERMIAEIACLNGIHRPTHQLEIQGYCEHCIN